MLDINPLSVMIYKHFLPFSRMPFHFVDDFSFAVQHIGHLKKKNYFAYFPTLTDSKVLRVKRPHGFAQGGDGDCKGERAGKRRVSVERKFEEKTISKAEWEVISIKRQESRLVLRNLGQEREGAEIQEGFQHL